jgi:hypothetical protein
VLWVTVRALGDGELALRAPSIAAGVAVIPLLYLTGRLAYDRRAGLAAAAFGTVAPLMVWYSHEARAYALFMLLALAAVYGQLVVLKRAQAWGWACTRWPPSRCCGPTTSRASRWLSSSWRSSPSPGPGGGPGRRCCGRCCCR